MTEMTQTGSIPPCLPRRRSLTREFDAVVQPHALLHVAAGDGEPDVQMLERLAAHRARERHAQRQRLAADDR